MYVNPAKSAMFDFHQLSKLPNKKIFPQTKKCIVRPLKLSLRQQLYSITSIYKEVIVLAHHSLAHITFQICETINWY